MENGPPLAVLMPPGWPAGPITANQDGLERVTAVKQTSFIANVTFGERIGGTVVFKRKETVLFCTWISSAQALSPFKRHT